MADPVNKLLSTPQQRYRQTNALMANQFDRATPQDGEVVQRAGLLPLGAYDNGQVGIAWPGLIAGPVEAANRLWGELSKPGVQSARDNPRIAEDAFEMAGGAATGSLLAPRPSNAVGIFGGRLAKTADQGALAKAEALEKAGTPREQIWNDTGWFKGVDGKWRFEIDDSGLKTSVGRDGQSVEHEDLARSYPSNWIDVAPDVRRSLFTQGAMGGGGADSVAQRPLIVRGLTQQKRDSVAAHELQHFVQDLEGFSQGGTIKDVAPPTMSIGPLEIRTRLGEQYLNQAGEVEARAVQKRINMTPEQRRARSPWLDYDVPEDQQIVRTNRLFGGQ
jgi:hypothetical protein